MIKRDAFIDFARAFAMLVMFFAHLLPHFSATEIDTYFFFRLLSSSAAPLFLFLTGLNFSSKQTLRGVFSKAFVFLGLAAFIDVVLWQTIPFYSFDVMYCIGFGYPLLYFFGRFNKWAQLAVICAVLILSFVLQRNYQQVIFEHDLNQWSQFNWNELLNNLFYNGWFPIFPWLCFMFLGVLSKTYQLHMRVKHWSGFIIGMALCAFSIYWIQKGDLFLPEMAVELFYPANSVFMLYALSFLFLFWFLQPFVVKLKPTFFLGQFGRYSLFYYLLHLTLLMLLSPIIDQFIAFNWNPLLTLFIVYILFLLLLFSFVWLIHLLKKTTYYQSNSQRLLVRMFLH